MRPSVLLITERDMFDHRNQQFSTILVAATIMLSALVAVLAQGVLHEDSVGNSLLVIIYSISNSLSMSFLFICDVFCMGVLWRASQFMKNRSRSHFGYLDKAIKKTKEMVRSIRGVKEKEVSIIDGDNSLRTPKKHNCKRRTITHMKDKAIADEFSTNEDELHSYLEQRERIIDKSAYIVSADRGLNLENKSFEYFWEESCSFYGNAAVLMFYAGSGSLIFANGTFVSSTFLFRYRSITGGLITSIIIILTLPIAVMLLIYMRYIEDVGNDFHDKHMKMKGKRSNGKGENNSHHIFQRRRKSFNILVNIWTPFRFLCRLFCGGRGSYTEIIDDNETETSQYDRNNSYENSSHLNHRINYSQNEDDQSEGAIEICSIKPTRRI